MKERVYLYDSLALLAAGTCELCGLNTPKHFDRSRAQLLVSLSDLSFSVKGMSALSFPRCGRKNPV